MDPLSIIGLPLLLQGLLNLSAQIHNTLVAWKDAEKDLAELGRDVNAYLLLINEIASDVRARPPTGTRLVQLKQLVYLARSTVDEASQLLENVRQSPSFLA
ncbi:hypothetical protein BGZ63DRAFT_388300, partial [Mariannaea sp. PMI_226]